MVYEIPEEFAERVASHGINIMSEPTDPYLLWAQATNYRDYQSPDADSNYLAVAIECKSGESVEQLIKRIGSSNDAWIVFPTLYAKTSVDLSTITFCTARVLRERTIDLAHQVKRFELGMAIHPQSDKFNDLEARATGGKVVIGAIEDFVSFANSDFNNSKGRSRIRYVWDQDSRKPDCALPNEWSTASLAGYGYETVRSKAAAKVPAIDALKLYSKFQRAMSHGSHVIATAAGNRIYKMSTPSTASMEMDEVDIIAVHFPRATVEDTSGGAMTINVLDGLHYILNRAGKDTPVVVNLSYGTYAGSHDGTSILEAAMDELLTLLDGSFSIVIPAGNQYEAKCHANFSLEQDAKSLITQLQWKVLPDDKTPSFVEVWLPPSTHTGVMVRLVAPSGQASGWVTSGKQLYEAAPNPTWGVVFPDQSSGSLHRTCILIALAATSVESSSATSAEHGIWKIEFKLAKNAPSISSIEAWIERDDFFTGNHKRGRQSYFIDPNYIQYRPSYGQPNDTPASLIKRKGSFNSITNGNMTIVAGGYVGASNQIAHYSGSCPQIAGGLRDSVDALAISEDSQNLTGIRGAGVFGRSTFRLNGTSVAAPQITRRIAKWFVAAQATTPKSKLSTFDILGRLWIEATGGVFPLPSPIRHDSSRNGVGRLPHL